MVALRRNALGFTLVEALISTMLMTLLIFSAAFAYNFVTGQWQRNRGDFKLAINEYRNWQRIYEVINNTLPKLVYVSDPDHISLLENEYKPGFYFLGRENGLTAVSAQSVQQPDVPAVYRLFREPDPAHQGRWQLVYEEAPLTQQWLRHAQQSLPFDLRIVLANNIKTIQFGYKGWLNTQDRLLYLDDRFNPELQAVWQESYDGLKMQQQPTVIGVRLDEFAWRVAMPDNFTKTFAQIGDGE